MKVGVVICTIGRKSIIATVNALIGQSYDRIFIVRDYEKNLAKARNKGWKALQNDCDVIAFTDDDCIPDKNFIKAGKKFFELIEPDLMQGKVTGGIKTSEKFFYVGANLWLKTSVLKKLKGFDEKYLGAGGHEELDLGWRLEKLHGLALYNSECIVKHPTKAQHKPSQHNADRIAKKFPKQYAKLIKEGSSR
jgi:GT2 family glycosyltransferase